MRVLVCAMLVVPMLVTAFRIPAAGPPPPPAFVPLSPRQGVYPVLPVPATFPNLPPGGGPLPVASEHSLTCLLRASLYPVINQWSRTA